MNQPKLVIGNERTHIKRAKAADGSITRSIKIKLTSESEKALNRTREVISAYVPDRVVTESQLARQAVLELGRKIEKADSGTLSALVGEMIAQ